MDDKLKNDKWESDSEKSDNDEDSSVATEEKQDESKLLQTVDRPFFIYKLEANPVKYPVDWNGPTKNANGRTKVYGLIICVKDQVCYIRTSTDLFTHKPDYLKNTHDLVGCWVDLTLDINNKIAALPFYLPQPIQTRVFKDFSGKKLPYLLLYDYVEVLDLGDEVKSKFLGRIENEIDLKRKNGEIWNHCNIEYMIECEFISGKFTYTMKTVKFHGSAPLHSGLPRLLSFEQEDDNNSCYLQEDFEKAFYNENERQKLLDKQHKADVQAYQDSCGMRMLSNLNNQDSAKLKVELSVKSEVAVDEQELQKDVTPEDITEIMDQMDNQTSDATSIPDLNVQEDESTLLFKKKTILITHADSSYALTLANHYLKRGSNVILQYEGSNNTQATQEVKRLMNKYGKESCIRARCKLSSEKFMKFLISNAIRQFGSIDVVFHFVSIYDARDVSKLLKENLDPYIEIVKRMRAQKTVDSIQLIVISPILYLNPVDEQVLQDVDTCLSSLRDANNKFMKANSADFHVSAQLVEFDEFKEMDYGNDEEFNWQICSKIACAGNV